MSTRISLFLLFFPRVVVVTHKSSVIYHSMFVPTKTSKITSVIDEVNRTYNEIKAIEVRFNNYQIYNTLRISNKTDWIDIREIVRDEIYHCDYVVSIIKSDSMDHFKV